MSRFHLVITPGMTRAVDLFNTGRYWLSAQEASDLLDCDVASLTAAAKRKNSLGTLEFYWAGNFLRISTLSVIRFLTGGNLPQLIFDHSLSEKEESNNDEKDF